MTDRIIYDSPTIVLPHSQEHWDLSQKINILQDENNWLEDAVSFNVYNANSKRLRGLVNRIFTEVEGVIHTPNRQRYREVLKRVLINLWHGHFRGKPVRYSRDRGYYSRNSMYGKQFIKYDRLIAVIDALEFLGYIEHRNGVWNKEREIGRTARMWATFKLWRQFRTYGLKKQDFYTVARPVNVIVVRDGGQHNKEVKFPITPAIRRLNDDLESYNDFLEQHIITLNLDAKVKVDTKFLTQLLYKGILNRTVELETVKLATRINPYTFTVGVINRPVVQLFRSSNPYTSVSTSQYSVPYHLLTHIQQTTMTQRFLPDGLVSLGFRGIDRSGDMLTNYLADLALSISMDRNKDRRKARLAETFTLKEIGIDQLVLRMVYEYLHRVFNRGSFKLGGRGYGAIHQRIPKHLRHCIHINGQPTVELDYSAYHIRMLYHQKGIDYRDDPYVVCEGPGMRNTYKAVGLIAINGDERKPREVIYAIRDELIERNISTPKSEEHIKTLIKRFKESHPQIADCLYNDKGVHLMNLDSKIMNNILMKLMDQGILGLSVYDSVVVAEQHQDYLNQVMSKEYERGMGFKPIIDVKKKP